MTTTFRLLVRAEKHLDDSDRVEEIDCKKFLVERSKAISLLVIARVLAKGNLTLDDWIQIKKEESNH